MCKASFSLRFHPLKRTVPKLFLAYLPLITNTVVLFTFQILPGVVILFLTSDQNKRGRDVHCDGLCDSGRFQVSAG